jgi:hypothetical protein
MCRNIKTLFNFEPRATSEEVRAASIQFVRKISGFSKPSAANEVAFQLAVDRVSATAEELLASLVTNAAPRDRAVEAAKARAKAAQRFGPEHLNPRQASERSAESGSMRDTRRAGT